MRAGRWIKIIIFLMIAAFPSTTDSCWAMTLQESRQKILDDYAYFDKQSAMRRQNSAQALVDSKNLTSELAVFTQDASVTQQAEQIYQAFLQDQLENSTGLVVSHPDDEGFAYHEGIQEEWAKIYANTQAYTYDQALVGIAMLKHGDMAGAKKIFDFFDLERQKDTGDFSGFWTVYNVDPVNDWKRYEWRKGLGENAWIALFALQYHSLQQDPAEKQKALELATTIGRWVGALPHHQGGIAMGEDAPGGIPNFGTIYSVENDLDAYALFKTLMTQAARPEDRQFFAAQFSGVETWLKNEAFDPSAGLFKRGGSFYAGPGQFVWDDVQSLDVQSWAISAIGIDALIDDFGISMDDLISAAHETFAVQDDGSFGGDIFQAKGFDFSDASNAATLGRSAMKWVEGTNHMILVYKMLSDFYADDTTRSAHYQALADHFLARNADNAVEVAGTLSYLYTDQSPLQVFVGTPWMTAPGRAVASAAWVYFSIQGMNPFVSFQETRPSTPFSVSASVSSAIPGADDLFIEVDENDRATVQFKNRAFDGLFDAATMTLRLDDVQDSPSVISESWDFFFETQASGSDLLYSLGTFESDALYSDDWLYHHTYDFTLDSLLESDYFLQMIDGHSVSELKQYAYATSGQKTFVESTISETLFDGVYGYGNETHYFYGMDADQNPFTRITVTQETRNDPLLRVLESYQLTIYDNGTVDYTDLGKLILPL